MDPSLSSAASGMMAQQTRVEVISNNLANVNTTGFKRSRAHFEDLLYQTVQGAQSVQGSEADVTQAVQVGRGTRLAGVQRVESQGPLQSTGRPLDLAIEGGGFFQVELPNGEVGYTRDGSFTISDQGTLVTNGGYAMMPGISIPPEATNLVVSRTGVVTVEMRGSPQGVEVGRIELARFPNSAGLEAMGENLFRETSASGPPTPGFPQDDGFGRVLQGTLEGSNVEIVQEMVEMITALRAYEINSKAVQSSEEMAEIANSLLR
jgi:flagellar basal-body rod protein FlgG